MKRYVIAQISFEGFHHWPDAPDAVAFLSDSHRHIFTVQAKKAVFHGDRDTEFILLGREIREYILIQYGSPAELGAMSCEHLAEELVKKFFLEECVVWEDMENAGGVQK